MEYWLIDCSDVAMGKNCNLIRATHSRISFACVTREGDCKRPQPVNGERYFRFLGFSVRHDRRVMSPNCRLPQDILCDNPLPMNENRLPIQSDDTFFQNHGAHQSRDALVWLKSKNQATEFR